MLIPWAFPARKGCSQAAALRSGSTAISVQRGSLSCISPLTSEFLRLFNLMMASRLVRRATPELIDTRFGAGSSPARAFNSLILGNVLSDLLENSVQVGVGCVPKKVKLCL